jgi:hypothetical protein
VPRRHSVTIATSTAQNDAGVFEFSFRDERYLPFEGAGAVSEWELRLPGSFRPFDYQSITDVILHVSYTAEYDGLFRENVEGANGQILAVLTSTLLARAFSLRQDFSTAFHRLLHSPVGTPVEISIDSRFVPFFLQGRELAVRDAWLLLRTAAGKDPGGFDLSLEPKAAGAGSGSGAASGGSDPFTESGAFGRLFAKKLAATDLAGGLLGTHELKLVQAGGLAPESPLPGDPSALDAEKLLDVGLYVEYQVAAPDGGAETG